MLERVLDASALLALLLAEPGADVVRQHLRGSLMCAVNHAEVLARLVRHGKSLEDCLDRLARLELSVVPFDAHRAALSASLLPKGATVGLSLGDRACLSLGMARDLPVLTADRHWADLDLGVRVELIR